MNDNQDRQLISFDWTMKKLLRSKANFDNIAKSPLDEWIYLFKNSSIKSDFKAKGIKEAEEALNIMKMGKEERAAYDRYLVTKLALLIVV